MKRITGIDVARGLVMIIMALDHIRDFIHVDSLSQNPTNLATTSPALFFTRWITHICAPTFMFLSGVSAFLTLQRTGLQETRKFLLSRGFWLILLELTIVNFGVWWDVHFNVFMFNVIAAFGTGFIVLGLLIKLPAKAIGVIGLLILATHNLAPLIPFAETAILKKVLMPFFAPAAIPLGQGRVFLMAYPPIPWLGILFVGFATGQFFLMDVLKRKTLFLKIGSVAILLFICIRFINIYGDSVPWSHQKNSLFTVLSFINVTKYPPSLDFCLLFLGILFLILAFLENVENRFTRFAMVYGKVPLFYFLIHWYIIHPAMFVMVFIQGFTSSDLLFGFNFGRPKEGSGLPLWGVYLIWIGTVLLLYPVCKWYGKYKTTHNHWWLKYI
jgi:uncharacterized membrane protein